eukprot:GFUD01067834.1.p1 GENE.GFUD01067834.1~~GFUD01067834.1.p1  ORF type:complete len:137 (+),score=10.49 GFUD01067834.1:163-573(+)
MKSKIVELTSRRFDEIHYDNSEYSIYLPIDTVNQEIWEMKPKSIPNETLPCTCGSGTVSGSQMLWGMGIGTHVTVGIIVAVLLVSSVSIMMFCTKKRCMLLPKNAKVPVIELEKGYNIPALPYCYNQKSEIRVLDL